MKPSSSVLSHPHWSPSSFVRPPSESPPSPSTIVDHLNLCSNLPEPTDHQDLCPSWTTQAPQPEISSHLASSPPNLDLSPSSPNRSSPSPLRALSFTDHLGFASSDFHPPPSSSSSPRLHSQIRRPPDLPQCHTRASLIFLLPSDAEAPAHSHQASSPPLPEAFLHRSPSKDALSHHRLVSSLTDRMHRASHLLHGHQPPSNSPPSKLLVVSPIVSSLPTFPSPTSLGAKVLTPRIPAPLPSHRPPRSPLTPGLHHGRKLPSPCSDHFSLTVSLLFQFPNGALPCHPNEAGTMAE